MPDLTILATVTYYLPGFKAGGPIRTLANMVDKLGDEFQFKIITADRDIGDTQPYPAVPQNQWSRVSIEEVFYMSPNRRTLRDIKNILCSTDYDVLYLNSFFSVEFTIKPLLLRKAKLVPDKPLVLAPRGELSPGALRLKSLKKYIYLFVVKLIGLYSGVIWQASSVYEEEDIRRWFGTEVPVVIAPNLPSIVHSVDELSPKHEKKPGSLNIIFLSRISRKKNLAGALRLLKGVRGEVKFNIYGPLEDEAYWAECESIIGGLSANIEVKYHGSVAHNKVGQILREHDLFFFPTLGENFGHVIVEAFSAGCPVLISDQTPWRDLEAKGVGWDLSLSRPELFQKVLQQCVSMDHEQYLAWSETAQSFGRKVMKDDDVVTQNRNLFSQFMAGIE